MLTLTDTYVLPEFRGNHLLLKQLLPILASDEEICIKEPTKDFIEVLLYYRFAEKLSDNLVASSFSLEIPKEKLLVTNKYAKINDEEMSFLYDLDLCSPILLYDITTPGRCDIGYQKMLKEDEKYCKDFRDSLNIKKYFEKFKRFFMKNHVEFGEILFELRDRIKINEHYAEDKNITEKLNKYVENGKITQEKALKIEKQLKREYNNKQVLDEGIETRIEYLATGIDLSNDRNLLLKNLSTPQLALCSNCQQPINSLEETSCSVCGWNISNGNYLSRQEIIEQITSKDDDNDDITLDLRGNKVNELMYDMNSGELSNEEILEKYKPKTEVKLLEDKLKVDIPYGEFETIEIKNSDLYYFKNEYLNKTDTYTLNENENEEVNMIVQNTYNENQTLEGLLYNSNIYEVLKEKNIDDKLIIAQLLLNDYIESKNYEDSYLEIVHDLHTVNELKEILRKYNLKVSGKKDELIVRLMENGLFNELGESEFILTEKGLEFLNYTGWIPFYNANLSCFDINEIGNYLISENDGLFRPKCEKYLNEHVEKAYDEKNFMILHDTILAKAICFTSWERYSDALNEELQLYMVKINPFNLENMEEHRFITSSNITNIASLSLYFNKPLKKVFNKNWKKLKLEKTVINKKTALKYLTQLVNGENIDKINNEIKKAYLKK